MSAFGLQEKNKKFYLLKQKLKTYILHKFQKRVLKQKEYFGMDSIKELKKILKQEKPKRIFLVTNKNSYKTRDYDTKESSV